MIRFYGIPLNEMYSGEAPSAAGILTAISQTTRDSESGKTTTKVYAPGHTFDDGGNRGGAPEGPSFESMMAASGEYSLAQIREAEAAANRMVEANIKRFPKLSKVAASSTMKASEELNDFMRVELEESLDWLYPEWREQIVGAATQAQGDSIAITKAFRENVLPKAMQAADEMSFQALRNVSSMLSGEIPDDVAAQLRRQAAEISQQIGVRGQAAQYLTARDLGLTSLDLMQQGLSQAPAALGLAPQAYGMLNQTLQMPVQSGANVTNLLSAYRPELASASQLYAGALGQITGIGSVNPTSAYQTSAQVGMASQQLGAQVSMFNTEVASQNYWNQQNMTMAQNMFQQQLKAQQQASQYQLFGSALGAGAAIFGGGLL